MDYKLKNGKTVVIRKPAVGDAEQMIHLMSTADAETRFLARNPGEFHSTVEREEAIIKAVLEDGDSGWFVVEYEGRVIGQCSVERVRRYERYRHRAEAAFVILQDYCGLGIGGKMMEECIQWCRDNDIVQLELDVVTENERALAMYKGFGFEVTGTQPNALRYPDGTFADEYRMTKYL